MCRRKIFIICVNLCIATAQFELKVKPEKCYGTFEVMDRHCCIFPPFFNRMIARECGAIFAVLLIDKEHDVATLKREMSDICGHWRCILDKYAILDTEDNVNNDKYFAHLDKWVALNPEFSNAMTIAKATCRDWFPIGYALTVCNFFDYQMCIRTNIMLNCPKVVNSQECLEWKEFYEECREFFT